MKYLLLLLLLLSNSVSAAVKFYENSTSEPLMWIIQHATSSLNIEIYEMDDPNVQQAILAAMNPPRNVKVNIIQEPAPVSSTCNIFGAFSSSDTSLCSQNKSFTQNVKAHGGRYVPFNKILCGTPNSNCFEHGKIVVADGIYALISTGNFDPANLCDIAAGTSTCNRDYTLIDTDLNVVQAVNSVFLHDLAGVPYNLPAVLAQANVPALIVSPLSLAPMLYLINNAHTKLVIQNQYLEDSDMNAAIIAAAKRGVTVYVMVASACAFGSPNASLVQEWTNIFTTFDQAGVITKIFSGNMLVNGKTGYLHAKAMIIDDATAWVGSTNGSPTSITNNREFSFVTSDPGVITGLYGVISADFNNPTAETWQESLVCKNDQ